MPTYLSATETDGGVIFAVISYLHFVKLELIFEVIF